jgi:hypothetical protein
MKAHDKEFFAVEEFVSVSAHIKAFAVFIWYTANDKSPAAREHVLLVCITGRKRLFATGLEGSLVPIGYPKMLKRD